MARRRGGRRSFSGPTLVPLADMLTNTVGVTIFIMIFTVLAAGGGRRGKEAPNGASDGGRPGFYPVHK